MRSQQQVRAHTTQLAWSTAPAITTMSASFNMIGDVHFGSSTLRVPGKQCQLVANGLSAFSDSDILNCPGDFVTLTNEVLSHPQHEPTCGSDSSRENT